MAISATTAGYIAAGAAVVGAGAAVTSGIMQYNAGQAQARTASAMAAYNAHQQELNAKMQLMSLQAQAAAQKRMAEAQFAIRQNEAQARFNNARSIENQIPGRRASTREEIRRVRTNQERDTASVRAQIGARNLVESSGTPMDVLVYQKQLQDSENDNTLYASELDNLSLFREAEMERFGGRMALAGATLNRNSELASAGLTAAKGQMEFRAARQEAELTRLSGAASAQAYRGQAVGNLFSGIAQGAGSIAAII